MERLDRMADGEFSLQVLRLPPAGARGGAIEARLGGLLLFVPR
jgi:hypothetical protein